MILVYNGRVITRDDKNPLINSGAVAIDGNKIVEVGDSNALKSKYGNAEMIDAKVELSCQHSSIRMSTSIQHLQEVSI